MTTTKDNSTVVADELARLYHGDSFWNSLIGESDPDDPFYVAPMPESKTFWPQYARLTGDLYVIFDDAVATQYALERITQ